MKSLADYTNTTAIFNKYGAFYAFSKEQLDESTVEGVVYVQAGGGLICPEEHVNDFASQLDADFINARKAYVGDNGIKAIIHDALANYECAIAMDVSDAVDALKCYGITKEQVDNEWDEYFQHCIDNDYI